VPDERALRIGGGCRFAWFMPPGVSGATNKSERYASNKLNLPRGQRRRHSAERKVSHISVDRPEVGMVEEVEEIAAQLRIAGFAEPRKMSILGEARIHVNHSGIAIVVAAVIKSAQQQKQRNT